MSKVTKILEILYCELGLLFVVATVILLGSEAGSEGKNICIYS